MRRSVLLLALAAAAILPSQARGASPKVAALQVALFQRGYYKGGFDGIAGPVTRAATKRFQRRHHLVPDGIAGPRTRAALGRWGRHELGRRELRRGRRGWDVAELQFLLRRNGLSISLDGIFGPATEAAVIGSQRGAGLATDGVVGPQTLAVLRRRRGRLNRLATHASIRGEIDRWSHHYGVDEHLACALAWMESGHQPNLTSPAGAWGVFQITPGTWQYVENVLAGRRYPHTVEGNVRVGLVYLRHLVRTFGDARKALAAWYTGLGRVQRHGIGPRGQWFATTVLAIRIHC
jgi:hypothetical protein